MQDPGHLPAPDDTGSATGERFAYQAQAALRAVLEMLVGGGVLHVTCEHFVEPDEVGPTMPLPHSQSSGGDLPLRWTAALFLR